MPASRDIAAIEGDFERLFRRLAEAFRSAPSPEPVYIGQGTLSEVAAAEAVGVLYGWVNRIIRTSEAALLLDAQGYDTEASPLIRSIIEHAIAAWWLVEMPSDGYQALVRGRQHQLRLVKEAQESGWDLGEASTERIGEALAYETEERSQSANVFLHTKQQATSYGLGSLYQAWLLENWTTHACLASAQSYLHRSDDDQITLLETPKQPLSRVPIVVSSMAHAALTVYNRLLPGNPLTGVLNEVHASFEALAEQLAWAVDAEGGRPRQHGA